MKFEYFEGKFAMGITMIPETPKECAEMLRIAKNAKMQKPSIYFEFGGENPQLQIYLDKVKEQAQSNTVKPGK